MEPTDLGKAKALLANLTDLATVPQEWLRNRDFRLEKIEKLLDALGHPERSYQSIHVAGSNGKGSVCALCSAALLAQGYRVGVYTSPHLSGPLDGIRVDHRAITEAQADALLARMAAAMDLSTLTAFEFTTALALLYFAEQGVDVAVVEVGLGGRLDATNVIQPAVSVITSIDLEHTSILGNSLAEIATEKAGILKAGATAVIAPQTQEARQAIEKRAQQIGTKLIEVGRDVKFERLSFGLDGQRVRVWSSGSPGKSVELTIKLLGGHQVHNAATAFTTLHALTEHGVPIEEQAIQQGFASAEWPGRFDVHGADPIMVLDSAHTPEAARALRRTLDDYFPNPRIVLVIGISADKNLGALMEPLKDRLDTTIATQSAHARALPARQLAKRLPQNGVPCQAVADPAQALQKARKLAGRDKLVLVTGSVFLVEQLRDPL